MKKYLVSLGLFFLMSKGLFASDYESKPIQVAVGGYHQCVLFENGKMKCWGFNNWGQLGYGDTKERGATAETMGKNLPFVNLGSNFFVKKIYAEGGSTCALSSQGLLKCWGYNGLGNLGYNHMRDIGTLPNQMGSQLPALDFRDKNNKVLQLHDFYFGADSACAIFKNGESRCWGSNSLGQLGIGVSNSTVLQTSKLKPRISENVRFFVTAHYHACAVTISNKLFCFGANTYGQIGIGNPSLVSVGSTPESMTSLKPVDLGTDKEITQVLLGAYHTCAVFKDGNFKCFGDNSYGELGLGRNDATFGLIEEQLGVNLPFVDIGGSMPLSFDAGWYHTCFIPKIGSSLKCWGDSRYGQLGLGTTENIGDEPDEMGAGLQSTDLGELQQVESVSAGGFTVCAIVKKLGMQSSVSKVKCWGLVDSMQFSGGLGNSPDETGDSIPFIDL